MKLGFSLLGFGLILSACSKGPAPVTAAPNEVDLPAVQTVGLAPDKKTQELCESELRSRGIGILYSGASGVMLLDSEAKKVGACPVTFEANAEIELVRSVPPRTNGDEPDLPTLLRLIPAEEIGARSFVAANPEFDGRKTVMAILDTGVEVDHPMLRVTTTNEPKVIDFADTSGEGRVSLSAVTAAQGAITVDGQSYSVAGIATQELKFGVFPGSSLKYSEDIAAKDTFQDVGVITYFADGRKARVDTNNDKSFADETELADYAVSRQFIKLGEKKSLTTSLKISDDGAKADLCFDDGTHGTHVAGIAAGYDAQGLRGVAPGAQVLAVKIGDSRLSGGSTTTASMLLAIDYAVQKKAHVINLSYGIRSGSNLGLSAIDQYVDKVAKETGILFSISAGNEGPGLLTTGTPAGASLAITNAAYVSKETAKENYGYVAVEDDNTWYFSSVGPRNDGGLKPTLMAPGSALASVPPWAGGHANYRGTSMASPQVTGGLSLLLSAALQSGLPGDRVSITRAVYSSAKSVPNLLLIEQGHGLMSVPAALASLKAAKDNLPLEFTLKVNSPTSPNGRGAGIYVRSGSLPDNVFNLQVTPEFPAGTSAEAKMAVKTFRLVSSAPWIKTPPTLWMTDAARAFQVQLDAESLKAPGIYSAKVIAIDEKTNQTAFLVPVTVLTPHRLSGTSDQSVAIEETIRVGQTLRYFVEVPAGTTSLVADLTTDGPMVWGQILDSEGRQVAELRDAETTSPMVPLRAQADISRPGVYEIDVVSPATTPRRTKAKLVAKAYSFTASAPVFKPGKGLEIEIQNNFAPVKVVPKAATEFRRKTADITVQGGKTEIGFSLAQEDVDLFSEIKFKVKTAKEYYDLMTDYPFRVFNGEKELVSSGGLELVSPIELTGLGELKLGNYTLEIQGAFTKEAPASWGFTLVEDRLLKEAVLLYQGPRALLETGQSLAVAAEVEAGQCAVVRLEAPQGGTLQTIPLCR